MDYKLGIVILVALYFVYSKIKSFLFRAKDAKLIKEDEALRDSANSVKTEIDKLKVEVPTKPLEPEAVEAYWNKDEKKS